MTWSSLILVLAAGCGAARDPGAALRDDGETQDTRADTAVGDTAVGDTAIGDTAVGDTAVGDTAGDDTGGTDAAGCEGRSVEAAWGTLSEEAAGGADSVGMTLVTLREGGVPSALLVGAPGNDVGGDAAGALYRVRSAPTGESAVSAVADWILRGEPSDSIGDWVVDAGDVDSDGIDDVLVGAPDYGVGGGAWLFSGLGTGEVGLPDAAATILGSEDASLGRAVAGGDLDGDGGADLIVGASGEGGGAGAVHGWSTARSGSLDPAAADVSILGDTAGAGFGARLVRGDIDADGFEDLLVVSAAADVYAFAGPMPGSVPVSEASLHIHGVTFEETGDAVAVGDFDGDGRGDLAVGAPWNADNGEAAGVVYLWLGMPAGDVDAADAPVHLVGERDRTLTGAVITDLGDLDGAGRDTLAVAAPWLDDRRMNAGAEYFLADPAPGTWTVCDAAYAKVRGPTAGAFLGLAAAVTPDLDGDGSPDLALTSAGESEGYWYSGRVYLLPLSFASAD